MEVQLLKKLFSIACKNLPEELINSCATKWEQLSFELSTNYAEYTQNLGLGSSKIMMLLHQIGSTTLINSNSVQEKVDAIIAKAARALQ